MCPTSKRPTELRIWWWDATGRREIGQTRGPDVLLRIQKNWLEDMRTCADVAVREGHGKAREGHHFRATGDMEVVKARFPQLCKI